MCATVLFTSRHADAYMVVLDEGHVLQPLAATETVLLRAVREYDCHDVSMGKLECRQLDLVVLSNPAAQAQALVFKREDLPQATITGAGHIEAALETPPNVPVVTVVIDPGGVVELRTERNVREGFFGPEYPRPWRDGIEGVHLFAGLPRSTVSMASFLTAVGECHCAGAGCSRTDCRGQWARVGSLEVQLQISESWHVDGEGVRVTERANGRASYVVTGHDRAVLTATHSNVWGIRNGGPYIALGGSFFDGFRARLGYEFGLGRWGLASVAADTDFVRNVRIAPTIGLVSPTLFSWESRRRFHWPTPWVPAFALSAGPVFSLAPQLDVGVRALFSASIPFFGLECAVDYLGSRFDVTLMGRVSL